MTTIANTTNNSTIVRKSLNVTGIKATVSGDVQDNYSQHTKLTYAKMFAAAVAGDVYAAEEMGRELAKRHADVSARYNDLKGKTSYTKDKAVAKLRWEQNALYELILELNGFKGVNGERFEGIIDMMKQGQNIDADTWFMFKDQDVDKTAVTSEELSQYSLIRWLNKNGSGAFSNVANNCTVLENKDGFAFTVNGQSYILDGEKFFHIINDGKFRQNVPHSRLGVMPSEGVPNFDGKSVVTTLDRITEKATDAETFVRVSYNDFLDISVYRSHLYQLDPVEYKGFKLENDVLAKCYDGDNGAIVLNGWEHDYYIYNLTIEKNAHNPGNLQRMRTAENGYLNPARVDENALASLELWYAFKEKQEAAELARKEAKTETSIATSRNKSAITAPKLSAAEQRKAARAAAAQKSDEEPY